MNVFAFTDNLDIVDNTPIKVFAEIAMVPSDQGGRVGPFTKGFRPNHNLGGPDNRLFYIGQIEVDDSQWVYPGDTKELYVTFLNARGLRDLLTPGTQWRIQEGGKLIGLGTVISVS